MAVRFNQLESGAILFEDQPTPVRAMLDPTDGSELSRGEMTDINSELIFDEGDTGSANVDYTAGSR